VARFYRSLRRGHTSAIGGKTGVAKVSGGPSNGGDPDVVNTAFQRKRANWNCAMRAFSVYASRRIVHCSLMGFADIKRRGAHAACGRDRCRDPMHAFGRAQSASRRGAATP